MFNVGDKVKVITPSYVQMSKGFFLDMETWNGSDPDSDEWAMLGGEYQVLELIKEPGQEFFSLLANGVNNRGVVISTFLMLSDSVRRCEFRVGDLVVFTPACDENDQEMLRIRCEGELDLFEPSSKFKVASILNEYYIFLELPQGEGNSGPFCWRDFTKCRV
jgi:hypothetical protein